MRRALFALSVLAGCSGEPPTPAPQPGAQPTPAPFPTATRSPRPLRPGQLPTPELDGAVPLAGSWSATPGAATYRFEGGTVFAIRCDRAARRIVLSRGVGEGDTISLFTDNAAATFPAQIVDGALETPVTTGQTFLDALAGAEVFAVASGKSPVLRVPGNEAIGAVVRGCRPAGR